MGGNHLDLLVQSLNRANQLSNDYWQIWRYVAPSKKLVLCGYKNNFDVTAFLIFYETIAICLPRWIENAVFSIEDNLEPRDENSPLRNTNDSMHFKIYLSTPTAGYFIVCQKATILIA
jgi:hypothetical protein